MFGFFDKVPAIGSVWVSKTDANSNRYTIINIVDKYATLYVNDSKSPAVMPISDLYNLCKQKT